MNTPLCLKFIALSSLLAVSACTWVKPLDGADNVAFVKPSAVRLCDSLGRTSVQTKAKLGFIPRDNQKIQIELMTLAKNAAMDLGADTIVETKPARDGKQTFALYKCKK